MSKHLQQGHDAACYSRKDDQLNRWPLAKEIYRIAVGGPEDWSVRVGIYGEWGTGKTSILNFIKTMATEDGHLVFSFNPWKYHSKDDLWKAFVNGLYGKIEEELGEVSGSGKRKGKNVGAAVAKALPKLLSVWKKEAGDVAETGIHFLAHFTTFSADDLKELKIALGGKRLIITIDDLDRTDGDLVPEILYALKEIMDVPGMAFICAFDPVVVGKVLGQAHPGHDDGLKFLDKIIDYPRYLPDPTEEQLIGFAKVEMQKICPFVPVEHVDLAVPLLPSNPRSIRQFIRILALLKPQINRHHPAEIKWPFVLTTTILKVRFPKLAYPILRDKKFWEAATHTTFLGENEDEEKIKVVTEKIDSLGKNISDDREDELKDSLQAIVFHVNCWNGMTAEALQYQANLTETPHAVTWKEFDAFFEVALEPSEKVVQDWAKNHAGRIEETCSNIYKELMQSALSKRKYFLEQAANATTKKELKNQMVFASRALAILRILLDLQPEMPPTQREKFYNDLMEQFAEYYSWTNEPKYSVARREEKRFINNLFDMKATHWQVWLDVINMYYGHSSRGLDRPEWNELENSLRGKLRERCALWLIEQFASQENFLNLVFGEGGNAYQYKTLILDSSGPIWTKCRARLLKQLKGNEPVLQHNAYLLLSKLLSIAKDGLEATQVKQILTDTPLVEKLWKQCLSNPLNPRMVGSLRKIRDKLQNDYDATCPVPKWWERTCAELDRKKTNHDNVPSES